MFSQDDESTGVVMGVLFGVIALVISLIIGLAIYQKNKTVKAAKTGTALVQQKSADIKSGMGAVVTPAAVVKAQ